MNKRSKYKAGLFFGSTMAVFFIIRNLLTEPDLTSKNVIIIIASGLIGGVISGFLFAWFMGLFVNSKTVMKDTKIDTQANETILFNTGANHFKGAEGVGGRLYLTNKRLVFKSHRFNIQNHELSIELPDIEKIERYKTLGIVNNGLAVTTMNHKTEKFVVQQIDEWLDRLIEKSGLPRLHLQ